MPIIRVELWPGRSTESKVKLAKALTEVAVEQLGCPVQSVTVVLEENPKENWVFGGEACAEGIPSSWKS